MNRRRSPFLPTFTGLWLTKSALSIALLSIRLAPGGTFLEDGTPASPFSIFQAQDDLASIRKHVEVFHKLMRRYKYLLRGFEDTLSNLLQYLNKFSAEDTNKLATATGLFCASGLANLSVLSVLFKEHLVKEGKLGLDLFLA